jgi:hypothetical protein
METFDQIGMKKLPNSTAVLVLGIISIPSCCCFYGLLGLILSIVALVLAKKDYALYNANPGAYELKSYSNLKAGRICAIVGLTISGLTILSMLLFASAVGWEALNDPELMQEKIKEMMGK